MQENVSHLLKYPLQLPLQPDAFKRNIQKMMNASTSLPSFCVSCRIVYIKKSPEQSTQTNPWTRH